jgi:hypothetical protein
MLPVQHERHGIETCLNASAACARTPTPAQHSQDAHRVWPVNLDVISWLGAFHVRNEVRANFVGCPSSVWVSSALWCTTGHSLVCTRAHADPPRRASVAPPPPTHTHRQHPPHAPRTQVYERALPFFDLAAAIQPQQAKWSLMVASCLRRMGAYAQALQRCVGGCGACAHACVWPSVRLAVGFADPTGCGPAANTPSPHPPAVHNASITNNIQVPGHCGCAPGQC